MAEEFTLEDLRVMRRALYGSVTEDEVLLREKVIDRISHLSAARHMIATGSYPAWYRSQLH